MKRVSILYLLLIWLCLLTGSCKQSHEPTSVFTEAESLMYTHPDSALALLEAIPNSEQFTGKAQADYALLLTQARSRNLITATSDSLIRIAVDYYQNSDEKEQKAKSLLYWGDVLMDMERYADATLPLKQAEEFVEDVKDPHIQTLIYNSLGYLNREAENYKLCLSYYKKALQLNHANGYTEWIVSNLINIINLPISEFADSVETYIHQLQQIIVSARPALQTKAYNSIGVYYQEKGQITDAESCFIKSIQLAKETNYHALLNLADIYEKKQLVKRADSLYQIALQSPIWATKALVYENLYKRKLKLGQTEEAAYYMNEYIQAVDSFYTHRESNQIQEIQQKYDQEVLLHKKVRIENWLYRILFGFILFLSIIGVIAWGLKKKHQKQIQALQEQISKVISSSENDKAEISKLNQMLVQNNIIKQTLQLSTLEDIQALELYLQLLQSPHTYNPPTDFKHLQHWLNLAYNNFALRLKNTYPHLTPMELTLCYLQRMGYSQKRMSETMQVKEDTIKRNIYRTCEHLNIENDKGKGKDNKEKAEKFAYFVNSF